MLYLVLHKMEVCSIMNIITAVGKASCKWHGSRMSCSEVCIEDAYTRHWSFSGKLIYDAIASLVGKGLKSEL